MATFRILLVEDEPQTARMVRFYLEREGFAVVVATDGPAGEAALRREQAPAPEDYVIAEDGCQVRWICGPGCQLPLLI